MLGCKKNDDRNNSSSSRVSNSSSNRKEEEEKEKKSSEDINPFSYSDDVGIKQDEEEARRKKKERLFLSISYPIVVTLILDYIFFSFCGNGTSVGGNHIQRTD